MIRSEKKEKWIKCTLAILLCLVLASFWMMCNIYAKYTAEGSRSDGARVALFGSTESITIANDWIAKLIPGSTNEYTLTVTNQKESEISEVSQSYQIEIQTAGNLPLKYTLKNGDEEIGTFTETSTENTKIISTEAMKFKAGVSENHTYVLHVEWPETKKDVSLQGIPDFTKIIIHTTQID